MTKIANVRPIDTAPSNKNEETISSMDSKHETLVTNNVTQTAPNVQLLTDVSQQTKLYESGARISLFVSGFVRHLFEV